MKNTATVYILDAPYQADKAYDYFIPSELGEKIHPGCMVSVPYGAGNRKMTAVVTDVSDSGDSDKLKPVFSVLAGTEITVEEIELCFFLKDQTICTFGDAYRVIIPKNAVSAEEEYFTVPEEENFASQSKLGERALYMISYIRSREKVGRARLRHEFGLDYSAVLSPLIKSGHVIRHVSEKKPSAQRTKAYISITQRGEALLNEIMNGGKSLRSALQKEVLMYLSQNGRSPAEEIYDFLGGAGKVQVASLEKKQLIAVEREVSWRQPKSEKIENGFSSSLSEEQEAAYKTILELYRTGEPKCALLHGVTGSGKTQVIKSMIDAVTADGQGVIVLVPEISLTPQMVGLFCACYGDRIAVIHSGLSAGERYDEWLRIRQGEADIVIGTRSAVFAPVKNLGMIVIDEEQEHTYKSDTDPKYSTHDVAKKRCAMSSSLLLLSSATPSLASYYKAKSGAYTLVELKNRYGGVKLPDVIFADMRKEALSGSDSPFSSLLLKRLNETVKTGKQAIFFLNRRGYNSSVVCRRCGSGIKCPNCSVSMTFHLTGSETPDENGDYFSERRRTGYITCHYCGYRRVVPEKCPECGASHFLFMGCGTQRAQSELSSLFPGLKIIRMDMDTTSTKNSYEKMLGAFRRKEADVLLGTQMVTKGHDFPEVTLVGVIGADSILYLDDYRAGEKTFAMLTQVIGRAGRAGDGGVAVIQSFNPDSDVLRLAASQDYAAFYEKEIRLRKSLVFPPFCDIAVVTLSSRDEGWLLSSSQRLRERITEKLAREFSDVPVIVFGPFEAPVYKIKNNMRMRFVIKCKLNRRTRSFFAELKGEFSHNGGKRLSVSVDFNPSSL